MSNNNKFFSQFRSPAKWQTDIYQLTADSQSIAAPPPTRLEEAIEQYLRVRATLCAPIIAGAARRWSKVRQVQVLLRQY